MALCRHGAMEVGVHLAAYAAFLGFRPRSTPSSPSARYGCPDRRTPNAKHKSFAITAPSTDISCLPLFRSRCANSLIRLLCRNAVTAGIYKPRRILELPFFERRGTNSIDVPDLRNAGFKPAKATKSRLCAKYGNQVLSARMQQAVMNPIDSMLSKSLMSRRSSGVHFTSCFSSFSTSLIASAQSFIMRRTAEGACMKAFECSLLHH